MLLACGFVAGQEAGQVDFEGLRDGVRKDPGGLFDKTIVAFSLQPSRAAERHEMLTRLCKEGEFPRWASLAISWLEGELRNGAAIADFHESIAIWLEQSDPRDLAGSNLSWVSSSALDFFGENLNNRLPDLFDGDWRKTATEWDELEKGSLVFASQLVGANEWQTLVLGAFSELEEGWEKKATFPLPAFALITGMRKQD